jgi:predicted adenine nucleotide alpha hydrolase (AANH) superfamily ATPase
LRKDYDVTAYFYDPNIHPEEEYRLRLEEMKRFSHEINLPFISAEYDVERWFDTTKGHEMDQEKGERCSLCFDLRLNKTVRFAKENGFDFFATVLSISPHKDAKMINRVGQILSKKYGIKFLEANFKKREGFKKSVLLSKEYGLKRQDYCGCIYSQRN